MSIYSELDMVIADHVGYHEEIDSDGNVDLSCADTVLYDNIVDECSKHIQYPEMYSLDKLSKDAQMCLAEWERIMQDYPQYKFDFEKGGIE